MSKKRNNNERWYSVDLHLHTPASSDYKQENVEYIDILKAAEMKGLDMIAFTDHNTINGYKEMMQDIEGLEYLQTLNRILPDEIKRLKEYKRLLNKIKMLPGFEFTATFGFHILCLFPEDKSIREIEHLLLDLGITADILDEGAVNVGSTTDVITLYHKVREAGGMAIAAHANSNNGIAMRGVPFGGQTRIAYTQDPNLFALEVTDLESRSYRSTSRFFNGTKPEYPRRMHCIQGSDAHRITADPNRKKVLGVGDRVTEIRAAELSFDSLKYIFESNDFARTRPRRQRRDIKEFDFLAAAREEGANIIQDFHHSMNVRGGHLYAIIADICAFANTNGGTLFIGMSDNKNEPVVGIKKPSAAIEQLSREIENKISPDLECTIQEEKTGSKNILRILIPRGSNPPYAVDDNKIYIRSEAETSLAVRDEIVELVRNQIRWSDLLQQAEKIPTVAVEKQPKTEPEVIVPETDDFSPPKTGVEIVTMEKRRDNLFFTIRDLRNGNVVRNVTVKSARKLWAYAISQYQKLPSDKKRVNAQWKGNLGIMKKSRMGQSKPV